MARYNDETPGTQDDDDLNDRQNGWQANVRVDNRGDERSDQDNALQNDWRDEQWRETASKDNEMQPAHPWHPNDDAHNEQRDGSAYDRDSEGNSRFHDEDHGYRASTDDVRDYGHSEDPNDPRQPRDHTATSERDYDDRNPTRSSVNNQE